MKGIQFKVIHPVTRKKIYMTAKSLEERAAVRDYWRQQQMALKIGAITADELVAKFERLSPSRKSLRTLADAARSRMKTLRPRTAANVRAQIENASLKSLANEPLETLDARRMGVWLEEARTLYADSTIVFAWRIVSAVMGHALTLGWVSRLPWGAWRPTRLLDATPRPRERATSPDDVARLLAAAHELDRKKSRQKIPSLEARCACAVLLGLRAGELAGLRWSDFDRERARVSIERQYDDEPLKAGKAVLAVPAALWPILEAYGARLRYFGLYGEASPVFPAVDLSKPFYRIYHASSGVIESNEVQLVARVAGLPNPEHWTVHSLRASFVCLELQASGSIAHAMNRARHRSLKSTQAYARDLAALEPALPAWTLPASSAAATPALPRGEGT